MTLRPVRLGDLELMLAWRSDPEIYRHFREQDGPLEWKNHVEWFVNRSPDRQDHIIEYNGRHVGSVNIDEEDHVGVYIGEKSLCGEGIATRAVQELCGKLDSDEFYAEIHTDNESSQRLFEKCGFKLLC
ncbi:GNAT family N-acetyltransferase [Halobellus litoreus]|uniref:GNAT family N-acetyltransferase n=1 Tax=Halobellus litoreus TaxID=755310 RepID=UPI0021090926